MGMLLGKDSSGVLREILVDTSGRVVTAALVDSDGNLLAELATLSAGEDQAANVMRIGRQGTATLITFADVADTTIAAGACCVERVDIGVADEAITLSIYDGTAAAGTLLAIIDCGSTGPHELGFDVTSCHIIVSAGADTLQATIVVS